MVDEYLVKNMHMMTKDGPREALTNIPLEGVHYLYNVVVEDTLILTGRTYMTLTKVKDRVTNLCFYKVKVSLRQGERLIHKLFDHLTTDKPNSIHTVNVINSGARPYLQVLESNCSEAFAYQKEIANRILDLYENSGWKQNVAVILTGAKNCGKTFTLNALKKEFDRRYLRRANESRRIVRFITNFDPCLVGNDIRELVLQHVTNSTPAIILLDELQDILEYVLKEKNNYIGDNRVLHAFNRKTWNEFIDAIRRTHNTILVATSMESFDRLQNILHNDDNNLSMIRHGRFDGIIEMTREGDSNRGTMKYIENNII